MEPHLRPRAFAACAEFPNDNPALHGGAIWRCVEVRGDAVCERALAAAPEEDAGTQVEPTPTAPTVLGQVDELADQVTMLVEEVAALVAPIAPIEAIEAIEAVEPLVAVEQVEPAAENPVDDHEAIAAPEDDLVHSIDGIEVVDELPFDDMVLEEAPGEAPPARAEASASDPFAVLLRVLEEVARAAGCAEDTLVGLRVVLGAARVDEATLPCACVDALLAAGMLQQREHALARAEPFARQVVAWQGVLRGESEDFGACGGAMLDEWCAGLLARIMGSPARVEGLRRDLRGRGVAAFGLVADAA
jgi:hypothetical protein